MTELEYPLYWYKSEACPLALIMGTLCSCSRF